MHERRGGNGPAILAALAVCGCIAAALIAAQSAGAAAWLPPVPVSTNAEDDAAEPRIAISPAGDAVAVWSLHGPDAAVVEAAARPAGGSWSAPVELSREGGEGDSEPRVAIDASGNAVAVWFRYEEGGEGVIDAAVRPAGDEWSAAETISDEGEPAFIPSVAMSPGGEAVALWTGEVGVSVLPRSSTWTSAGGWTEPVDAGEEGEVAFQGQVAITSTGEAIAAWAGEHDGKVFIRSTTRPAGEEWTAPEDRSDTSENSAGPALAVNPEGDVVLAWAQQGIRAAVRPAGGAWSAPDLLTGEGEPTFGPDVAIAPGGTAVAAWQNEVAIAEHTIESATLQPGEGWTEPDELAGVEMNSGSPRVAIDPAGSTVAAWTGFAEGKPAVRGAHRAAGGAWSTGAPLSETGQRTGEPSLAVDSQGNAAVAWTREGEGNTTVEATLLDASGPQLNSLSVPTSGTAGEPVSFSVSPFDLWSPPASTGWDFGDGTGAAGTAVTHTYAAPGSYEVNVTGTDTAANSSVATGTIEIGPSRSPAAGGPPARSRRPGAAIAARIATVKHGKARLRLRCGRGACAGRVDLLLRVASRRRNATRQRGRTLRVGRARFRIPARRTRTVVIPLTRKGKATLLKSRRHRLVVRLGGPGVRHRAVILKQA